MADDVARMRELLALSLRAPEPQRSAAEKGLQQLQQAPVTASFLAALLDMCVAVPDADGAPRNRAQLASEDADVRLLAVLWLKHLLRAQWRARQGVNLLSDEERAHVRGVLLFAALHEPQQTVALHLALVVAAIARAEFPAPWSFETLFPVMLQPLVRRRDGAADLSRERRGVDVCYRVVKELAARRLMQHRKQFAMLSVELLPLLLQYWTVTATQLNDFLQTQGEAAGQTSATKAAAIATALATSGAEQLNVLVTATKLISTMLLNAFRDLAAVQGALVRPALVGSNNNQVNGQNGLVRSALVEFYNQLERLVKFRQAFAALVGEAGGLEATADVEEAMLTLDKCMHRIAAIVVGVQNSYPMEFREYLPPYLTLFWNVLNVFASAPSTALPSPRRLQIDALQFFANVLSCRLYKSESLSGPAGTTRIISKVITATGDVALTDAIVLEAQAAVQTFFTQTENRFASMLNLVVMHYMTLTAKDLEEWQSDPEAHCTIMESLTAKESVRACAENVFLTLVQNFPGHTIPALTQMTSSASTYLVELGRSQIPTVGDDGRVLDMDAVLLAIGLGCYDLHDCFEFEPWFLTNLVPILVNPDAAVGSFQGLPVLRFRIVWLVSCWLAQLSANVRPPLYDALLKPSAFFHQADADVALKLRIIQTLESMVNDWGFEHDAFAPFLPQALECLFAFFPQADESESKMKVLGCLEAIIQACGAHIVSFCHQISAPLPALWANESDASNLVRGKILQLMAKLLSSVKEAQKNPSGVCVEAGSVQTLLDMCVQVIRFATDVSNPDEVFLMESGLELWNETIEVSTVYTEELHLLFNNVLRLMERDYEHVALVLSLLEDYLRLGKAQFWQTYHANVSDLLQSVIGNVKAEASRQIAQVTEIIVATVPAEQVAGFLPVVKSMVEACITFQQGEPKHELETVIAGYVSVVARLMMTNFDFTLKNLLMNDHAVLLVLVDVMLKLFYTVGSSPLTLLRRKVWALALCSTLMLMEQPLLEKTGQVLEICVEVIEDEQEEQKQAAAAAGRDDDGVRSGVYRAFQAHHKNQQQEPSEEDAPVLALDLKAFVCGRLNDLAAKLGGAAFDQLLQTVDSSVLRKFQS
ncbi:Importin-11 [Phytophthora pseudosyringae]|uniref:Importin-11 n=1 Tax=Phytophthora pseudosyringae TaxID=221518 RepID=A0A8T1W177_9STRA|nr:Importin-11 [Phytophthora pseudosyringae]